MSLKAREGNKPDRNSAKHETKSGENEEKSRKMITRIKTLRSYSRERFQRETNQPERNTKKRGKKWRRRESNAALT
jgi:hypothetical protein